MKREELRRKLQKEVCKVVFIKKDNTERTMYCTLRPHVLEGNTSGSFNRKEPSNLLTVWDIIAQGWRMVNLDTLIEVEQWHSPLTTQ
jgi:hypothetical protein